MRRLISPKSDTCPEGMYVYAAGIGVKVGAHYPGRSVRLSFGTTAAAMYREGRAEVSRGHSRFIDRTEGPNVQYGMGDRSFDNGKGRRKAV